MKEKNAVYHLQISDLVLEIFVFQNMQIRRLMMPCTQPNIIWSISIEHLWPIFSTDHWNLVGKYLYRKHTYGYKCSVPIATHSFPVPTWLILICYWFSARKTLSKAMNLTSHIYMLAASYINLCRSIGQPSNFQRDKGEEGANQKNPSWEGCGYFLKQTNKCRLTWTWLWLIW